MLRKIFTFILLMSFAFNAFAGITAGAALASEEELAEKLSEVKEEYMPGETYFVSHSNQKWVGSDNTDGDKTKDCEAKEVTNSHGRFGNLWQSMGFANYVFYNVFGEMPKIGYHCNPSELNNKVEIIGRYASKCRYLRGTPDGEPTEENIKALLSQAKQGDILVVAPEKKCNSTGRAMIIMDVSDNFVTVYHADYKGKCEVSEDTIAMDALSEFHCLTLLRSANYPYPDPVPPSPIEKLTLSGTEFSLNENIDVTWPKNQNTSSYKLSLVNVAGEVISEKEKDSLVASFLFEKPGEYFIKAVASNEYGESEEITSDKIIVHNEVSVSFIDHDGKIITTQKVEYGKDATAPNVPKRKGFNFAGWSESLENITAPTEIYATYEREKYTVKYYDVGKTRVIFEEEVPFEGTANLPTNYTLDSGYIFAGWQISFESEGLDYTCVDGDMTLVATQKWADQNRPLMISVGDVVRDETATYYTLKSCFVQNYGSENIVNFKLLGTLKTAEGKALKTIVLEEISLGAGEYKTISNKRIVYSEKATKFEIVAVGMVGNSKTGGQFSPTVSRDIEDNSNWGSWTEWTTEDLRSSHDDYETKTQYRARNKTYTTATSATLSGWTKYDTKASVGSWSGWQRNAVTAFTNDAQKREVNSQWVPATYKTQYHYYHYCEGTAGTWTHYKSGRTFHEVWVDSKLPYSKTAGGMDWYKGSKCARSNPYYFICDGTTYGGPGPWTRQVQTGGGYTQYQYRDTYYTYYYWKWLDWSDWTDASQTGDEVATRTLYRYRDHSVSGDAEDNSGETYDVSGVLENVTDDFNNSRAAVMVYKKSNSDPTEEQLVYVGETTIGEGNSYSFSFKPKEMPTAETGDFIVALGIEGADRLINIEIIEAEIPVHQVKFIAEGVVVHDENAVDITDSDGNSFRAQLVKDGESAIAPEAPEKEGHIFVKWSDTVTGIKTDKVISAVYEPIEYTLVFIDWEKNTVESKKLRYGSTIPYPELEAVSGSASRAWDKQLEGIELVTDNMIIGSVAELNKYNVKFSYNGEILSEQTVVHGHSAVLPETHPESEGMTFAGWVGSCSSEYITQDVVFNPYFIYSKTVKMPEATVTGTNADGSKTVELSCPTEGAEIYYVINSHNEEEEEFEMFEFFGGICCEDDFALMEEEEEAEEQDSGFKSYAIPYTGEITLESDETITFIAFAEGMNESIPVSETNQPEQTYYALEDIKSSLRQYRSSIEGDVSVNILNNLPEFEFATVMLAFYDHRGVMIDIIPQNIEIIPGKNVVTFEDVNIKGNLVKNADSVSCKIISWLSGEGVTPVSDFALISIK